VAKKRVHEIAKEQGLSSKELLAALKGAGVEAKAAASSVEEADALKAIQAAKGNGGAATATGTKPAPPAAAPQQQKAAPAPKPAASTSAPPASQASKGPVRPAGKPAAGGGGGGAGKKRRVVIDSQAARRDQMGGPPPQRPPRRRGGRRRRPLLEEPPPKAAEVEPEATKVPSGATVREVAELLGLGSAEVIKKLMTMGEMATLTQTLSDETVRAIAAEYDRKIEIVTTADEEPEKPEFEDSEADLEERPPVVAVMGHVDHGKTSLLDVIRKTNVVAGEAGGITQHIGAYTISFPHPERKNELQQITFLDTPGHAAFSSMRARGANVTDIVVLVVAANDGVMPQTLEALSHAQAAKAEIIVAVNKCDHPNANPMRVRQQLQEKGLVCEEWGGKTLFVDVSALTKQGVDKLLEAILLQAEIMELKANPNRRAKGNVIESGLEPGGPTATVLVRKGTLRPGDIVICGQYYGKVRALINEENKREKEAGPSVAVKLLGLNGVPEAGLEFSVVENEKEARALAETRSFEARALGQEARTKVTLENLFATMTSNAGKVLKVVVKADTQGSVEAIVEALKKIESEKVSLEVIHSAVGTITESDVSLASASEAVILGFHTRIDNGVSDVAKREGVQIKLYAIIYELIDQVKESLTGLLDPILKDVVVGSAEVRKIFDLSKGGPVAGCMVTAGRIVRGKVRVMRRKGLIYEGVTQTLRRFQDEVNEVRAGMECGIRVEGFGDFQVGDAIECYAIERVAQKL